MPDTYNDSIADKVRALVADRRLTQHELADQLEWSQPYISRRLSGHVAWSTDDLERLAKALAVPLHELVSPRAS